MITHVDLFSGIGGFTLACNWAGVETIAFAETNNYASKVLCKYWPQVVNYGDIRQVPALSAWLLTGGVPCQPASSAGRRRGTADDRWLWPEALEVVRRGSYQWLLFENPTGILSLNDGLEFESICAALEDQNYEVQPVIIPACAVGAPHRRDRVWIVAHSKHVRWVANEVAEGAGARVDPSQRPERTEQFTGSGSSESGTEDLAYTTVEGLQDRGGSSLGQPTEIAQSKRCSSGYRRLPHAIGPAVRNYWSTEPNVGRVANGVPARVDRIRCLGNAIVPQVAYQLIKRIVEAERGRDGLATG